MAHQEGEAVDLTEEDVREAWREAEHICIHLTEDIALREKRQRLTAACTNALFQTKLGKKVAEKRAEFERS